VPGFLLNAARSVLRVHAWRTPADIRNQKREHSARLQGEEKHRLAARAINDTMWDVDLQLGQIHWSDTEGAVLGHAGATTTPLLWWKENIHPDDRERVYRSFHDAVQSDCDRWSEGYRFRGGDGSYADIFDRGFIVRDEKGTAIRAVGAMADLTERRRAEMELRRLQAELFHLSRVNAMGTMASTIAHELNQPLAAVSNYISGSRRLLSDPNGSHVEAQDALLAAENAALRGGQILKRLREFVSRGEVSVAPEDLATLIEEACQLGFLDERPLGVTHKLELDRSCGWVAADRIQVQQVLINLIRNAVQAMQASPVKEVIISSVPVNGNMAQISVADSGPGIASEVRARLFSPLQSTKGDGMGIGLSISRTIIEAHSGEILGGGSPRRRRRLLFHPAACRRAAHELSRPSALTVGSLSRGLTSFGRGDHGARAGDVGRWMLLVHGSGVRRRDRRFERRERLYRRERR
jgi:two-component system sensor kinase FixL